MAKRLVGDVDRYIVELLNFLLERHGHQILQAENGREGLETVLRERPDLIILDIMMPEMNGFVMNTRLQEDQATRKIPVIILTAKGQARDSFEMTPNIKYFM